MKTIIVIDGMGTRLSRNLGRWAPSMTQLSLTTTLTLKSEHLVPPIQDQVSPNWVRFSYALWNYKVGSDYVTKFLARTGWTPKATATSAGAVLYRDYNWFIRFLMKCLPAS